MLLLRSLSYQSPFHSWTPLCRRLHPVMPLRMRPRRRLISLSPRYLLTWQCRRLSTVSTPHLWMLLCRRSHTVLFLRRFLRRWVLAQLPRFLLTCLFRLPHAVLCYTILPHNYRSRSSLLDVSSRTILLNVSAPDIAPTCTLSSSSLDSDDHVRTLAPRVLLQPPPGLEQYAPPPGLAIDATCALHMAYLLKRHLYDPGNVQLSHSRPHSLLLVPSMWEHIMRDQLLPAREVLVLLWREPTILSIQILVQGLALFLNREPSFFLWSTLVNPNLKGTGVLIQPTVISCIINIVFLSSSGIQAQRAEILLTLSPLPVVSIMQLFSRSQ